MALERAQNVKISNSGPDQYGTSQAYYKLADFFGVDSKTTYGQLLADSSISQEEKALVKELMARKG
jgi:hypothetical protein